MGTHLVREGFSVIPGQPLQTIFGNTVPDFFIGLEKTNGGIESFGGMVEVKAKKSGKSVTLLAQRGQIFKQLYAGAAGWYNGRGTHTIVTTGGVRVSPQIRFFGGGLGIRTHHISAIYSGNLSIGNIGFKAKY